MVQRKEQHISTWCLSTADTDGKVLPFHLSAIISKETVSWMESWLKINLQFFWVIVIFVLALSIHNPGYE